MGKHKTEQDLLDDLLLVSGFQASCQGLIDLLEKDDHLEITDYFNTVASATLEELYCVLDDRAKELDYAIDHYDPDPRSELYDSLNR